MNHDAIFFLRQFPLESFKIFLGQDTFSKLSIHWGSKRRKRLLGLEGFIWLGLFVAAHAMEPSLQQIFLLARNLGSALLRAPFVSVSAFCQYRAFFPSENSRQAMAKINRRSISNFEAATGFMAWPSSLGSRQDHLNAS
jgi:hypothetical protein